jgi:hypothetical protein
MDWDDVFDWDNVWKVVFFLIVLGGMAVATKVVTAPKNIDYYYLSRGGSGGVHTPSTCVYAHWTWHADEVAFCTDDSSKALDFANKANLGLHTR